MLSSLKLRPMVDLDMRLGEGTGAAFGLSIITAASRIGAEMLTFEQAAVTNPNESECVLREIRLGRVSLGLPLNSMSMAAPPLAERLRVG